MKLLVLFILFAFVSASLSDVSCQEPGQPYKYSKISLVNGKTIRAKGLSFAADYVYYTQSNYPPEQDIVVKYHFNDIKEIFVAEKTYALTGFLAGTTAGLVAMAAIENNYEEVQTDGVFYVQKIMSPWAKVGIIGAGSLVGTFVGASVKKGWKKIYPMSTSFMDHVNIGFSVDYCLTYQPKIGLKYNF
ncbi:MAG: hypothetical protein U0T82_16060 [Bacteroidales bacterium]